MHEKTVTASPSVMSGNIFVRQPARSQTDAILADLKAGLRLTPLDALERHRCFRLAARVSELRAKGWAIETEMRTIGGKRVATYRLPIHQESWL